VNIDGLGAIAEVAIGLAGFSGVFVALTRSASVAPPEQVRLSFLLYTSLGALFLSLIPHALFTASLSDIVAWRVLGILAVVHATRLLGFLARAIDLEVDYPDIFPTRLVAVHGTQILVTLALAVSVLGAPLRHQQSLFIGALIFLLAQAALVFVRLLFFRRTQGANLFRSCSDSPARAPIDPACRATGMDRRAGVLVSPGPFPGPRP